MNNEHKTTDNPWGNFETDEEIAKFIRSEYIKFQSKGLVSEEAWEIWLVEAALRKSQVEIDELKARDGDYMEGWEEGFAACKKEISAEINRLQKDIVQQQGFVCRQNAEIEALKLGDIQWSHAFDLAKIEIEALKAEELSEYEIKANNLARYYSTIYACVHCGNPVRDGYCCGSCGSDDPNGDTE